MADPVKAADLKVSFGNVMQETVNIHCHSTNADLGHQTIRTSIGWYTFTRLNSDTTGDEYWCQFVSAGKPSTDIQVFVSTNAVDNMPCHCSGSECIWIIEDRGISCNLNRPRHWRCEPSMGSARFGEVARVWKPILLGACLMFLVAIVVTYLLWRMAFASISYNTHDSGQSFTISATTSLNGKDEYESRPTLVWEEVAEAPVARLDGAAVQIGHLFYVFAGYATIDEVHAHVDVYNLNRNTWESSFAMPTAMAHSHLGIATDGRFIYIVSGQVGSQCKGPTARNFVLDTQTRMWSQFLPLPNPRYAPATQLWRGRLHVMGGSKEDRQQPACEHWSISVHNGKALEAKWRNEISIPRGGPHRACVVVEDNLYVIGGQEGDFKAKSGSLNFKCSRQKEVVYSNVYKLEKGLRRWRELPPILKPISHIEFAWVTFNQSIVVIGGSTMNNPMTKKMVLLGDILHFNTQTKVWKKLGQMPYRGKTVLAAYWKGWLYFTAGQRDKGPSDPTPKKIMAKTWRTKLAI